MTRFGLAHKVALPSAVGVAVAVVLLALRHQPYALAIAWSAVLIASFVGWGSLVNLWLARDRWADWGLRAGWGMALFLLTGGYLCALRAAVRPVLVTQVAIGLAGMLGALVFRPPPRLSHRRLSALIGKSGVLFLVIGAYCFAAFTCFGYLGNQQFQPSDDPPLYFVFAEKLVQSGSLLEPFAVRRTTTFGGQVYLHASFVSIAPICYINVLDAGISVVLVTALLVGSGGRSGIKTKDAAALGLALLLLFSLQDVRVNTGSLLSGVVAVLTLYRTVRTPIGVESHRPTWPMEPRRIVALAALTVVCILLRTSNAAAVLPFVILVFASDFALGTRRPWEREALVSLARVTGLFLGAFVLSLLPWSVLLHESVGAFFFPLGHHNMTPGWTFLDPAKTLTETANNLIDRLLWDKPVSFLPFAIVGLVPLAGRARNDLVALTIGSLIGVLALARGATSIDASETARFSFAYLVAAALLGAASVRRFDGRAALVATALGMHLARGQDAVHKQLGDLVRSASQAFAQRNGDAAGFDAKLGDYREVQSRTLPGATIATAVPEGWQFDFKRNEIFALDALGGMGPKPGWPAYRGPDALGDYLQASGVKYLIWVDFDLPGELYNRAHRQSFFSGSKYLQEEAHLELDTMESIERLSAMRRVVYRAHGMTVVDISQPPGA